jgi:hypothetical protein
VAAGAGDNRHEQGHQDGNEGDDHQCFDQGERATARET